VFMRVFVSIAVIIIVGLSLSAEAAQVKFEELKTLDGSVYKNVEVLGCTKDFITIKWDGGSGMVRNKNLPDEILKQLGVPTAAERKKQAEQERQEAAEKQRRLAEEQQRFSEEQRAKGLVKFAGKWMTPAEKIVAEKKAREANYDKIADKAIKSRSHKNKHFKVIQALDDGLLCVEGIEQKRNRIYYTGDIFFLYGLSRKTVADEEIYVGDLFWAGTYTYTTVAGAVRTVNSYCLKLESARHIVRAKLGLNDDQETADQKPPQGQRPPVARDKPVGSGSGFVITQNGYIITNHHVIKNSSRIKVKAGGELLDAKVVSSDRLNDIALLKVDANLTPVIFASATSAKLGDTVFTVGFPMPSIQGTDPKVTKGVISSLKGIKDDVTSYQIDAAVQPGNSGGPLANERGRVIGVIVARLNNRLAQNVNYAIKKVYVEALLSTCPEAKKLIPVATNDEKRNIPFVDAVESVKKATVIVLSY